MYIHYLAKIGNNIKVTLVMYFCLSHFDVHMHCPLRALLYWGRVPGGLLCDVLKGCVMSLRPDVVQIRMGSRLVSFYM